MCVYIKIICNCNILCFSKYCVVKEQSLKSVSLLKTVFNLDLLSHIQYFTLSVLKNMQSLLLKCVLCVCAKTNPFKLSLSLCLRPQNGSMILYNRKKVKYRKDGYCWKKRKDGKTTREDHMKLKVQGVEVRGCSLLVTRYNHRLSRKPQGSTLGLCVRLDLVSSDWLEVQVLFLNTHAIEEKTGVQFFHKSFDDAFITLTCVSEDVFVCVCPLHMTFLRYEPGVSLCGWL